MANCRKVINISLCFFIYQ